MVLAVLKEWFLDEQRDLPWRMNRTPYRVWVSEIMLQQTQVSVVIPYFHRFMQKFPTVEVLAHAPLEEVMKAWEGLGYYSRARNLHKAAQIIVNQFHGVFPENDLATLPGFGSYTTGAVLSFAFQKKAAAVDGNVIRVLSRLYGIDSTDRKFYEELTLSILPDNEPWIIMEALIELGAQICQKKPECSKCPLSRTCVAYGQGAIDRFPPVKKRPTTIHLERDVFIVRYQKEFLVRKGEEGKVMAGLYEFPYVPHKEKFLELKLLRSFPIVKHGFTRYHVKLHPSLYEMSEKKLIDGFEWRKWDELLHLPFSSGHRRILEMLKDESTTH